MPLVQGSYTGVICVNTAGLKPSLTITYSESNAEDNSAFVQVAENSATVAQVRAQASDGSKLNLSFARWRRYEPVCDG